MPVANAMVFVCNLVHYQKKKCAKIILLGVQHLVTRAEPLKNNFVPYLPLNGVYLYLRVKMCL